MTQETKQKMAGPTFAVELRHVGETIGRGKTDVLTDEEPGLLLGYFLEAASPEVMLHVVLEGESKTRLAHDESIKYLLQHGLGLAPGDVTPVFGVSPDPHGTPNPVTPYVVRYKTTADVDITGESEPLYAMAYTPVSPPPYNKLKISLHNLSGADLVVHHLHIYRLKT